jgi:TIR domain-containing protein
MANSIGETIQQKAYRLLKAVKARTENSHQPVFVAELAPELQMNEAEVQRAFRYLKGKRWIDTFSIDHTARINAAGHDVVAEVEQMTAVSAKSSQPDEGSIGSPGVRQDAATEWDVFISHASEDKESFVRPLAKRLQGQGLRVWFDELTLTVGDSLRRSIDGGLARSRYGIVVISPNFLQKEWPQKELDGLVAREIGGVKVILPVWHNIGADEIRAYSPTLADRLAVSSSKGLDHVKDELLKAIRQRASTSVQTHTIAPLAVKSAPEIQGSSPQHQPLSDYASELHRRRVAQVLAAKAPVAIMDGGALVMHVVPFSAIDDRPTNAFEAISREPHKFVPISNSQGRGRDHRITYDGLLVGSNAEGLSKPQRAYVNVSRTGTIEAVVSSLARGQGHNFLVLPQLQALIIKYACMYARTLDSFSVSPPLAVCLSLINVQGFTLLQDFIPYGAIPEDLPCGNLDRNQLDFGQVIFEGMPPNYNETAKALRPILAHLANAAGLHSSPYFDAVGNYTLVDKL